MCLRNVFFRSMCLLALLVFTGCGSSRYQMNIGNGNPHHSIQDVQVSSDQDPLSSFYVIAPNKIAAAKPRGGKLPQTLTVTWTDSEGERHTEEVNLSGKVEEDFRGQLVVEITAENTLTFTQVASEGEKLYPLPWTHIEPWEGNVLIPGMEQ